MPAVKKGGRGSLSALWNGTIPVLAPLPLLPTQSVSLASSFSVSRLGSEGVVGVTRGLYTMLDY